MIELSHSHKYKNLARSSDKTISSIEVLILLSQFSVFFSHILFSSEHLFVLFFFKFFYLPLQIFCYLPSCFQFSCYFPSFFSLSRTLVTVYQFTFTLWKPLKIYLIKMKYGARTNSTWKMKYRYHIKNWNE